MILAFTSTKAEAQSLTATPVYTFLPKMGVAPQQYTFGAQGTLSNVPENCSYVITITVKKQPPGGGAATTVGTVAIGGANGAKNTPQYMLNHSYNKEASTIIIPNGVDTYLSEVSATIQPYTPPGTPVAAPVNVPMQTTLGFVLLP